jgi:hypothetical protein
MEPEELEPRQIIDSLRPGDLLLLGSALNDGDTEIVFVVNVRETTEGFDSADGESFVDSGYNYEMLRPDGEIMSVSSTMLTELARQKVLKVLYRKSLIRE